MRKLKYFLILGLILVSLTSCTETSVFFKNMKSSTVGLDRDIKVTDFYGNEVWSYSGKSFITDSSELGNVTISYYENGTLKKVDFIGFYNIEAREK